MGIDYNKQRKDREDNNGASGESIVDYWGSSPALCHKFFGKKGVFYKIVGQEVAGLDGFYSKVFEEYFLNWGIEILGFTVAVGINAATALTVGILGFPGILVLYGLAVYHML